ncbi:Spo0J and IME4 domain-containing protein [Acidovorax soli]|uniref:N6-adenosine-specific RNA methylase IME4 n=1 Tax=Acidovorax soli TaxID=592050 RepID=A0A1H4EZR5_9BURK|nr:MT-A70 family methyltransferase [Acidovorax soli]SEA90585.1 N6-adenosine-specific RNA methylase IME4 [Acidovorax soli]
MSHTPSAPSAASKQKPSTTAKTVTTYPLDPCVELFPAMNSDEFNALKQSIQRNGQSEPILLFRGQVVDGRHRLKACQELGIEPKVETLSVKTYEQAKSMAFARNINRRNLTTGQRALMAAALCTRKPGQAKFSAATEPPLSQTQAADLFAVSRDSVQRAVKVYCDGGKELNRQLASGETTLNEAHVEVTGSKRIKDPALVQAAKLVARHKEQESEKSRLARLNRQALLSQKNAALPTGKKKYSLLLADPPWNYGMSNDRSASRMLPHNHYPTMSTDDICAMDVQSCVTKDAMLYLWCPASLLPEGLRVMQSWGFEYLTNWVWHKNGGKLTCAGGVAVAHHELLLVGKRGQGLTIVGNDARESSVFAAPVTQHSAKPALVHERLERLYPSVVNRLELFARNARSDWDVWGNQSQQSTAAVPVVQTTLQTGANDECFAHAA